MLVAAGAGVAYYLHVQHESRDVHGSSTVEFVTTGSDRRRRRRSPVSPGRRTARTPSGSGSRTASTLAPPFRRAWTFRAQALVEFPPAIAYGRLFFANNAGVLFAIGAKNGKQGLEVRLASLRRRRRPRSTATSSSRRS